MKITYNLNEEKAFEKLNLEPNGLAMQTLVQTCLRFTEPYTPHRTGTLIRSAITQVNNYEGTIGWYTPYAQYLYYGKLMVSPTTGSSWAGKGEKKVLTDRNLHYTGEPMRGAFWFERMKLDRMDDIIREVKAVIGK